MELQATYVECFISYNLKLDSPSNLTHLAVFFLSYSLALLSIPAYLRLCFAYDCHPGSFHSTLLLHPTNFLSIPYAHLFNKINQLTTTIPSSYSDPNNRNSSSGLNTGSLIGVVVGVVVIATGILFGLAFLMRRRIQKRKRFNAELVGSKPSRPFLDNELDDMPVSSARDRAPGPVSGYVFHSFFQLSFPSFSFDSLIAEPSELTQKAHLISPPRDS